MAVEITKDETAAMEKRISGPASQRSTFRS
jgi:hypothetical protein